MGLLYVDEHLTCPHYQKEILKLTSVLNYKKGNSLERISPKLSKLCFVNKGEVNVSINGSEAKIVKEKEIFLLPPNSNFKAEALEDSDIVTMQFHVQVNLCENYSMTQLFPYCKENKNKEGGLNTLKFTSAISKYIDLLSIYINDGIHCMHFYEVKKRELFTILRAYYPKEELAAFFYPILSKEDLFFKKFVMEKSLSAKNIPALAEMANYSTSGFIKKFTRCFNESPHRWISQYKANHILQDIKSEEKSLKEISEKYNFSSMSHFVNFCKKQFGMPPGRMRKDKSGKN